MILHYPNQKIMVINHFLHLAPIGLAWRFPLPPPKNTWAESIFMWKEAVLFFHF